MILRRFASYRAVAASIARRAMPASRRTRTAAPTIRPHGLHPDRHHDHAHARRAVADPVGSAAPHGPRGAVVATRQRDLRRRAAPHPYLDLRRAVDEPRPKRIIIEGARR